MSTPLLGSFLDKSSDTREDTENAMKCATRCTSWICNNWAAGLMAGSVGSGHLLRITTEINQNVEEQMRADDERTAY